jgi:hypothetical protein
MVETKEKAAANVPGIPSRKERSEFRGWRSEFSPSNLRVIRLGGCFLGASNLQPEFSW